MQERNLLVQRHFLDDHAGSLIGRQTGVHPWMLVRLSAGKRKKENEKAEQYGWFDKWPKQGHRGTSTFLQQNRYCSRETVMSTVIPHPGLKSRDTVRLCIGQRPALH